MITLSEYADKVISKKTEKEIKKNKYQTYTNYDKRTGKVESDSVYLYSLRPESIFCVYFGCDTDIKVERRINKLLNSEQKKHVLYYKAVLNKNEYKLNYRKLKYEDLLNIKDLLKYKET